MSRTARLPLFIREAMRSGDGEDMGTGEPQAEGALGESPAMAAERSLWALEDALSDIVELEAAYVSLPDSMLTRAPARLESLVLEAPLRYAPFFARAAELFDLSEDAVIAELARLRDPAKWKFAGKPGVSKLVVHGGPAVDAAECAFVRIKPGVCLPKHWRVGTQRVLVLEGSYEDRRGVVQRAGELREWPVGTSAEHSFRAGIAAPCILASVVLRRSTITWPLRALRSVLRR